MRCGCENGWCEEEHAAGACTDDATVGCAYVGGLCSACATYMDAEYLRGPLELEEEREAPADSSSRFMDAGIDGADAERAELEQSAQFAASSRSYRSDTLAPTESALEYARRMAR